MFNFKKYQKEAAQQKLTQKEICERTGISQTMLSRYHNGRAQPLPATIQRLAEALGVDFDVLWIDPRDIQDVQWHYAQVLRSVEDLSNVDAGDIDPEEFQILVTKHNSLADGYRKLYGSIVPESNNMGQEYDF